MNELPAFLDYLREQDRAPSTVENYRVNLKLFSTWFEETTGQPATAATVTPLDIRQYREWAKPRYKPSTVNHKLIYLRGFFAWAVATGAAATNPTANIKILQRGRPRPKWLTRREQYVLLRFVQERFQLAKVKGLSFTARLATRNAAILLLLLNTGLRISELANLRMGDVAMSERGGKVMVRYGKGGKYREIPLNADARRAIRAWLDVRQVKSDWLFTSGDTGDPLTRQSLQIQLSRMGKKVGVHLHPHLLRHTFAKNLVNAGVSLERVAALMGHSDIGTTAIYTTPSLKDLEDDVQKIQWGD